MTSLPDAGELLDREFLQIRHRLLDVASALDRIGRSDGGSSLDGDARMAQIREALDLLRSGGDDRAERVQMAFSRPYDPSWRDRAD